MSLFINCHSISKSHGFRTLFKDLSLGVFERDKIGLIGPNGAGKSTLLKILCEQERPDEGNVVKKRGLHINYVPQETTYPELTIEEIVQKSLTQISLSDEEKKVRAQITLGKLGFKNFSIMPQQLSGGWKKRLDIACALIAEPDLLLLDEPTNHLDLEGILWLEQFLSKEELTYIVISHDRYFLEKVCNKVIEINAMYPEGAFISQGSYSTFLEKREDFLQSQKQIEHSLSSKVRREIEWLKQNPKARTTKASSRIQEAERLIKEFSDVKTRNKELATSKIDFSSTERGTKKLLTAKALSKHINHRTLFSNIDLILTPGSRLGIMGENGSGKTTFLKILAGEITADSGVIKYAEDVKIVYFDQHRQKIPADVTLKRALSPTGDTVNYRGQNIHVSSWAKRFLFTPDLLEMPVSQLSGGERARILIARLMLQPADILLLDEPTNDLDINTLETLEDSITSFPGAVVLVTHDRFLLDRATNQILAIDIPTKEGLFENIFADYRQWQAIMEKKKEKSPTIPTVKTKPTTVKAQTKKLSFKEKQELDHIEEKIQKIEQEIEQLENIIRQTTDTVKITQLCQDLDKLNKSLEDSYHRWQELESKQNDLT